MTIFSTTLSQMAFLLILIVIGYLLSKFNAVPSNAATVLSKLENTVLIPALVMGTFVENFTVERLGAAWKLLLAGSVVLAVTIPLAIWMAHLCAKDGYTRKIFTYGLAFSNFGFMGNAIVSVLFPDIFLDYLIFTLPFWIAIYLWAVPALLITESGKRRTFKENLKSLVNPMFLAMLIGMLIGLAKIPLPTWLRSVISASGSCMSPIAMLLTGMTVASIHLRATFRKVDIYVVSLLRLVAFPLVGVGILSLLPVPSTIAICTVCALAMPLGLNTIVIPSAYGKDTSTAAGMALISHILSCVSIPLIFMLLMNMV